MKRNRLLIFGAGVLCLTGAWRVTVYAQTLGGTVAAVGAGTTLGAVGGSGLLTPGQYAAPATRAMNRAGQGDGGAGVGGAGVGGATGGGAAGGGGSITTTTTVTVRPAKPLNWGASNGDEMVNQLMTAPRASRRATASSSRNARRIARMTKAQRSRMINAKYQKPAVGYLSWYLKEDRYKVTSKVWQFVTTPNDRYYYRPWAPSMRTRSAARVIGFHTWQDAMIAGYRPDPVSKPEPSTQLMNLAALTRGPMLSTYFEYVYAGQITPSTFDANYRYVQYVANTVRSHSHTRHLVGETVEKVLGAAMGQNELPTTVGPPLPQVQSGTINGAGGAMPSPIISGGANPSTPPGLQAGSTDRREEDYNRFGNNAAGLARKPGP